MREMIPARSAYKKQKEPNNSPSPPAHPIRHGPPGNRFAPQNRKT